MVYYKFPYNPLRDMCPVSGTGFIDLKSAMVNNTIPAQLPDSEVDYNGMDEPSMILGKPHDVFEAMDMQKYVNEYKPEKKDNAS